MDLQSAPFPPRCPANISPPEYGNLNSRQRSTMRFLNWYPAILSVSFLTVACSTIYISAVMRRTSTSSERFEGIPSYILAIQFLICAGLMMLLSQRPREGEWNLVVRFGAAVLGTALLLAVAAMTMTLWHAEQQNRLQFCIYHQIDKRCACRAEHPTEHVLRTKWTFYENIDSCRSMDRIFMCMVAITSIYALAGFICFLAITHMCMLWQQSSSRRRISHPTELPHPPNSQQYSEAIWMRILGDLRLLTNHSPPTYSQVTAASTTTRVNNEDPPPPYDSAPALHPPSSDGNAVVVPKQQAQQNQSNDVPYNSAPAAQQQGSSDGNVVVGPKQQAQPNQSNNVPYASQLASQQPGSPYGNEVVGPKQRAQQNQSNNVPYVSPLAAQQPGSPDGNEMVGPKQQARQ